MKKRMTIMLIVLGVIFGIIIAIKLIGYFMFKSFMAANKSPIVTVSAMKVNYSAWQPTLSATGSVRAIRGVNVTTQLAGMVEEIYFTPGATVKAGDKLVQLNADTDVAQLEALKANSELALITYNRDKAQYAVQAISKQIVDADLMNLKNLRAQVEAQSTIVEKKTIVAPFTGRLGVNNVNPGQYLNPGDSVVMLQTLDPIYVDFFVPQQQLSQLKIGDTVEVKADAFPKNIFTGKITTINPAVDVNTRNVQVEATINNPEYLILPGMFVHVSTLTGKPVNHLTLPQTAISFNPYGELVFVILSQLDPNKMPEITDKDLFVQQRFVKTGATRGDQIAITSGLKAGELIVTAGQLKLKNGTRVEIDNSVVPLNDPNPNPPDDH